jgi:predicted Fe-Mo cluster-binding NifX family protein
MKIVVSANGKSLESEVNPRFGRTAGFLLYDTETGNTTYLENSKQQNLSQ